MNRMKVADLAKELSVPPEALLGVLRTLRISVLEIEDRIDDGDVALPCF